MTLQNQIKEQMKDAMRAKDEVKLQTIRSIVSSFTNELLNLKRTPQDELSDEEVLAVILKGVKQRKDSIEQFEKGGRTDLAEIEKAELTILETYLPKMMERDEVLKIAIAKKEETGVDKTKAGMFMGVLMKELKGKADGDTVKSVVDEILS